MSNSSSDGCASVCVSFGAPRSGGILKPRSFGGSFAVGSGTGLGMGTGLVRRFHIIPARENQFIGLLIVPVGIEHPFLQLGRDTIILYATGRIPLVVSITVSSFLRWLFLLVPLDGIRNDESRGTGGRQGQCEKK